MRAGLLYNNLKRLLFKIKHLNNSNENYLRFFEVQNPAFFNRPVKRKRVTQVNV
jgi:hypothetical protein